MELSILQAVSPIWTESMKQQFEDPEKYIAARETRRNQNSESPQPTVSSPLFLFSYPPNWNALEVGTGAEKPRS